jgi:hypothetical protein
MNIFDEIRKLDLPQVPNVPAGQTRQYAVVGSGVLAAHGIRDFKDIDLLATAELYEKLPAYGIRLSDLVDFKRAMGREKDAEDILLIENYLRNT